MAEKELKTPCYLVDEALVIRNLEILQEVKKQTGCKILLAQKAFGMYSLYPLIGKYLDGTTASGLFEAKLGAEEMGKENHIFSPAYTQQEFAEIVNICGHIVFNSISQWERFGDQAQKAGCSCGIRINPECSTQDHGIYDPCAPGSRLGVTRKNFAAEKLEGIEGLHFHTLCEQGAEDLLVTLDAVEEKFAFFLHRLKWLNIGGGHHITRKDYRVDLLIDRINKIQQKYKLQIYIEPGEAVVLNAGFLHASVLEIVENDSLTAILDASAACHMPDVLEMPYRPEIIGAGRPGEKSYMYRLGGPTCLAGDVIGEYSFDQPLKEGDRLVFCDMAHYSMVKNNMFNGMNLPDIMVKTADNEYKLIRSFGYEDFKMRLS